MNNMTDQETSMIENAYHDALLRIEGQAELLARYARELDKVYSREADPGQTSPTSAEIKLAGQRLQSAFIAVVRVTAAYL